MTDILNNLQNEIKALSVLGTVKLNEPLDRYTTFKTGGNADILIYPEQLENVPDIIRIVNQAHVPLTVIGGGSNLLISDTGIRGLVVRLSEDDVFNANMFIGDDNLVYADAVITKERFIEFCIDVHLSGIQFMAGIPGTLGGGIKMNAGTYMGNFIDILTKVVIASGNGEVRTIVTRKEMSTYRNIDLPGGSVILGGYFKLPVSSDPQSVRNEVNAINEDRRQKHPLEYPCAGSIFKNPDGHSSWQLVDSCGLKGKMIGGAQVSELHTNFIINKDNATSKDIKNLIEHVQDTVYHMHKIELETEVKMIGDFS